MVRFADNNDFDFVKNSWSICFDDPTEFVDWNFSFNYSAKDTIIAESMGKNASVMQLMPYELSVSGTPLCARYISGVATLPEYRGRGLVRKLFEFGLPEMYKLGTLVSILVPAVFGMYEKFGYRKVYERTFYSVSGTNGFKTFRTPDRELISILDSIYKNEMYKKSVFINRSLWDWERILTDLLTLSKGSVLMAEENGSFVGYALVYPKGDAFEATEICGKININAVPVSAPPVMARIIKAEAVLQKLSGEDLSGIGITDAFIPQNNINPDAAEIVDISDLTERIFGDCSDSGYINLLL